MSEVFFETDNLDPVRRLTLSLKDNSSFPSGSILFDATFEGKEKDCTIAHCLAPSNLLFNNRKIEVDEYVFAMTNIGRFQKGLGSIWLEWFGGDKDIILCDSPAHILAISKHCNKTNIPHEIIELKDVILRLRYERGRLNQQETEDHKERLDISYGVEPEEVKVEKIEIKEPEEDIVQPVQMSLF